MGKSDRFEIEGTIVDINRNIFIVEVKFNNNKIMNIPCTLAGKLRKNNIRLIRGDSVVIDFSISDTSKGRIIWRNR